MVKVGAEITEEPHHPSLGLTRKTVICSFCRLWASDEIKKFASDTLAWSMRWLMLD